MCHHTSASKKLNLAYFNALYTCRSSFFNVWCPYILLQQAILNKNMKENYDDSSMLVWKRLKMWDCSKKAGSIYRLIFSEHLELLKKKPKLMWSSMQRMCVCSDLPKPKRIQLYFLKLGQNWNCDKYRSSLLTARWNSKPNIKIAFTTRKTWNCMYDGTKLTLLKIAI